MLAKLWQKLAGINYEMLFVKEFHNPPFQEYIALSVELGNYRRIIILNEELIGITIKTPFIAGE